MPEEVHLVKNAAGMLAPATAGDADILGKWKLGQAVKVTAVRASPRSLKHHQLYFAGLLGLAFDYWEPVGGYVTNAEQQAVKHFAGYVAKVLDDNQGAMSELAASFLRDLGLKRSDKIDAPSKNKNHLHEWVKIEAGWFDYVQTPNGLKKVAKSINFNSMGQEDFNQFYQDAFSVVWKFILSHQFTSEKEAQNAIDNLVDMG